MNTPDQPQKTSKKGIAKIVPGLASAGESVLWTVGIAAILVIVGLALVACRRKGDEA